MLVLGLQEVITADVVDFEAARLAFDRVVSIEMFEHMKELPGTPTPACRTLLDAVHCGFHIGLQKTWSLVNCPIIEPAGSSPTQDDEGSLNV